ncbi:DoxX family protein [bacterium]|jgi:thiosulfate dehydrogenase (quinone) large subunit|nr:DoxX family protein [bacterium]MBT3730235.1 DoxX family protein [bacterium]MBT4894965.1 DoxX family protein [bacterium]
MRRIIKTDSAIVLLRLALGWLFLYAGLTKVVDPSWTSKGFLEHANTFSGFYGWLASPNVLPVIDLLSQWGLTIIGAVLILGILVRFSSYLGALMMILFYFPALTFPYVGEHSFIVDEHIIYVAAFLVLASMSSNHMWSLAGLFKSRMKG